MPQILLKQGSLTDGTETVLVNASNTEANLGSGVSGAIRAACGPGYQQHIHDELLQQRGGSMLPGDVLLTDAGTHPTARFVVHVAVMDYRAGFTGNSYPTASVVERGCVALWHALETLPLPDISVAMVALGAGTGNLGVRVPTEIALRTLRASPLSRISTVVFYGYALPEYLAMAEILTSENALDVRTLPPDVARHLRRA